MNNLEKASWTLLIAVLFTVGISFLLPGREISIGVFGMLAIWFTNLPEWIKKKMGRRALQVDE